MATDFTAYHYNEAIMPVIWTICGVELKPFALGHYMLLQRVCNPLISNEVQETNMTDGLYWFFSALLICASSYEDSLKLINNDEDHRKEFNKFAANLQKNMDKDPNWNVFEKVTQFKAYLSYYMDIPIYTEEHPNKDLPSGTDWVQNIYVTFKKLGYAESDILNMNFRKLFYEWCSYAEGEGAIKVWNKQDVASFAAMKGL